MTRLMRTEPRNFDIVAQEVGILRYLVDTAAKELLLIIEARSPRQVAPHFQIFAQAMTDHVGRQHAFARFRVMRAARGMNMVVAGPPTQPRGIDPALNLERRRPICSRDD